jgi:dTMP kinase
MIKVEVEGTDGAGKTTALKYLIEQLTKADQKVLETREVGSPLIPVNVELRKLVLDPNSNMSGKAMELVFAAMRLENDRHYKSVGDQYDFIVSDRGWFSHLAYTDHNESEEFTQKLYMNFLKEMTDMPDVVIYLAVDGETALARRTRRGEVADVIELKGVEFQEKVRNSFEKYMELAQNETDIVFLRINANKSLEDVKKQIDVAVSTLLSLKKG